MAGSSVITLAAEDVVMKFKEPFLTKGLNQKLAVNTPPGVYRGFRLATAVAPLSITIETDPEAGTSSAVYETRSGQSLTVAKRSSFLVDLMAFVSKTVAVCIFASYEVGLDTFAEIRVYELDPIDELTGSPEEGELVILGTVVVPAAGLYPLDLIPAGDISAARRTSAWQRRAPESIAWAPLVRNPSFEWADAAVSPASTFASAFWEVTNELPNGHWDVSTGNPNVGEKHMELTWLGPGDIDASLLQRPNVPVKPGQLIRAQLFKQLLQIPVTGALFVWAKFVDSAGTTVFPSTLFTTQVIDSSLSTTIDASYVKAEVMIEAPLNATHLVEVGVFVNDATFPLAAPALRIDDVQFWVETIDPTNPYLFEDQQAAAIAASVVVRDPEGVAGDLETLLTFDKDLLVDEGQLTIERRDQQANAGVTPPALGLKGRIAELGAGLIDTDLKAAKARIATPIAAIGVSEYTLVWSSSSVTATTASARVYATDKGNGGMILTANASYTSGKWQRDILTEQSTKFSILGGRLVTESVAPDFAAATWSDTEWQESSPFVSQRRVDTLLTDGRTLLWEMRTPLPFITPLMAHMRLYLSTGLGDRLELTMNAEWDGVAGLWNYDQTPPAGFQANRISFGGQFFELSVEQRFTPGSWADNAWDTTPLALTSFIRLMNMNDMSIRINANSGFSNPSGFDAQSNTLRALNIPKMWCSIHTNGVGGYTVFDGFNISSLVLLGSFSTLFFSAPIDNGYFAVSAQVVDALGGVNAYCQVVARGPSGISFRLRDLHLGTNKPLNTNAAELMFTVFGRQTLV
jgi:hypothetical protein